MTVSSLSKYVRLLPAILAVAELSSATIYAEHTTHIITSEGTARTAIVIADTPSPAAYLAAIEVQHGIKHITGVKLPIVAASTQPSGSMILIGESSYTRKLKQNTTPFSHVEYMVSVTPDKIVLLGKDSPTTTGKEIDYGKVIGSEGSLKLKLPGMYDAQGTLRAAYHFLENSCGIRYYGPRSYLCHFPRKKNLSADPLNIRREPSIKYTNGLCNDQRGNLSWPIQQILYDNASSDEVLLFARRLRTGGKKWYTNHTYHHMKYKQRFGKKPDPRYPEIHQGYKKEFWPPDGSNSHQLCYTSEDLARQVAQDAADYFDGKLENKPYGMPVQGMDMFPVVPNDAGGYCTCNRCQKILSPHKNRKLKHVFGDGTATDYVFNFANMVARHLKKTHPDKFIAVLAYEGYLWQPVKVTLEPNVLAAPCLVTCSYWNKKQHVSDWKAYQYWQKHSADNGNSPLYLWNYYHHPEEIGAIRKHKVFPQFNASLTHRLAMQYHRDKVEGIFLCGWGEGLDFYALMKGFDNPEFNLDELLNEYFTLSFGAKSGSKLRCFYDLVEQISNDPKTFGGVINERVFWENQGSKKNLDRLDAFILAAEQSLPDALARKRFAPWKNLMTYMRQGHAEWKTNKKKSMALPPHTRIADGYIKPFSVYSANASRHYRLITGHHMIEDTPGVFGSRGAKLNITNDADRAWEHHGGPDGINVTLDLGEVYQIDEIRIWNFQQNRGYGLNVKGMKNVKIELSHESDELSSWKILTQTTIPIANDRAAFSASSIIPGKSRKARYVRITAVGGPGTGNWASQDYHSKSHAGLGQIRVYGKNPH